MPKYDLVFYDADDERVGEDEGREASDLGEALIIAANSLKSLQGNALVTCVVVEEVPS